MSVLNVKQAEERAREWIKIGSVVGTNKSDLIAKDFLALAALARRLARQLHGEAVATGEVYSGTVRSSNRGSSREPAGGRMSEEKPIP